MRNDVPEARAASTGGIRLILIGGLAVSLLGTLIDTLAYLDAPSQTLGFNIATDVWLALVLGAALALLGAGRIRPALVVTAVGVDVAALCFALLVPLALPLCLLLPIVALALALPHSAAGELRWMMVGAWLVALVATAAALFVTPGDLPAGIELRAGIFVSIVAAATLTLALLWQFHQRLMRSLNASQAANTALVAAQTDLETQVAERTAALQVALADVEARAASQAHLLAELDAQREVIRGLSVPLLPVNASTLVLPLVGALDEVRLRAVQERALQAAGRGRVRTLLLDISGVPVIDAAIARGLLDVVRGVRLIGAEAVLVGVRPEVAQSLVAIGRTFTGVRAFGDLEAALAGERSASS